MFDCKRFGTKFKYCYICGSNCYNTYKCCKCKKSISDDMCSDCISEHGYSCCMCGRSLCYDCYYLYSSWTTCICYKLICEECEENNCPNCNSLSICPKCMNSERGMCARCDVKCCYDCKGLTALYCVKCIENVYECF